MTADDVVTGIEAAIADRQPIRRGDETRFRCPAHADHDPSARWNRAKRVWYCDVCGAGGGYKGLAQALGLIAGDGDDVGLSVAELADAKGLPERFLRGLGVKDGVAGRGRSPCVDIPYADECGEIRAVRKRLRLTGDGRFIWRRGDQVLPYGLGMLRFAREEANFLLFVEGESDQWVCRHADLPALGIPGASTFKSEWARYAEGVAHTFVWQEPGTGGVVFVERLAAAIPAVRVITAPVDAKDPAELWLVCNGDIDAFQGRMSELAHAAPYASAVKSNAARQAAHDAFGLASSLLRDPALLSRVEEVMRDRGYAGDTKPPLIAYVGLTSRLLRRPLNLAFVAPSGAGKNRAIDTALELMPGSAYVLEKAGSERALIYGEESYEHRIVVVAEADSIPEDGPAASAIRSLASDNEMTYDTVEKDERGHFATRRVTKPGPTGLFTTSTRPLPRQFDTRTLTVTIADTPGQTRDVMRAHAAAVMDPPAGTSVEEFVALQTWLEGAGDRAVYVPFADALAELVPANHVRMRRDFRQLLTMVEALSLLHQSQRDRDAGGRIIAALDDYAQARTLLADVFQAATTAGLTEAVRQTVQQTLAIYAETPLTIKEIADALALSKDTVWRRIQRALALGYLVNDETRKGRPAQIRPGDPLPDDTPALPTVAEVQACVSLRASPDSTVQPRAESESAAAVETAVERGIQPVIQPVLAGAQDSHRQVGDGAVERLNADPTAQHTTSGGDREVFTL